jgi:hypothetical protein
MGQLSRRNSTATPNPAMITPEILLTQRSQSGVNLVRKLSKKVITRQAVEATGADAP